jgi:hypothetical protein
MSAPNFSREYYGWKTLILGTIILVMGLAGWGHEETRTRILVCCGVALCYLSTIYYWGIGIGKKRRQRTRNPVAEPEPQKLNPPAVLPPLKK